MRILFLGDVVGRSGRNAVQQFLADYQRSSPATVVCVNGENTAGGIGIDPGSARELWSAGADVITLGDHSFHVNGIAQFLADNPARCIRPANFPPGAPGAGYTVVEREGRRVGFVNLLGRVFIELPLDCPFRTMEGLLEGPLAGVPTFVDFHAEATSEKVAFGRHFDGRIAGMVGTHTHVQTADETILPGGTAYLSDLGMCGPRDSVVGMDSEVALKRFLTGTKHSYRLGHGPIQIRGAVVEYDVSAGVCTSIERIQRTIDCAGS